MGIYTVVPISTATIIIRLFIPVHLLLLLFPTSKTFYQYGILTTDLSGRVRYTFAVKSDAGFVAPMITRGFSHFWKFPCLVLTYSRNLQAGLSALTTSKHFSSPSHTAAYFSVLLGSSAVFSRLPQTVLWTLFYNVAAALVDVMRGDAGLVTEWWAELDLNQRTYKE